MANGNGVRSWPAWVGILVAVLAGMSGAGVGAAASRAAAYETFVQRDVYRAEQAQLENRLDRIEHKLDRLIERGGGGADVWPTE